MIDYLNQNQGAVMAALTLIYVAATIILVFFALKQAKFAQQSLDQFRQAERNRYRPYVIFDVIWEEGVAYAAIKNSGISPALDVAVSVEPRLEWADDKKGIEFIERGISFLAPNREISEPFSWAKEFYDKYTPYVFKGTVNYSDSNGAKYEEGFCIDIAYTQHMGCIGKPDVPAEIKKIREAIQTIASKKF